MTPQQDSGDAVVRPTPGPWIWTRDRDRHAFVISRLRESGAPSQQIASFSWHNNSPHFPTEAESEANARLIAAAPDMLEALQGFNLKEEWIMGGTADSLTLRVPLSVIQKAAAAVAKATSQEGR